jgi:hypothetical protein
MFTEMPRQLVAFPRGVELDGSPTAATIEIGLSAVRYYELFGADKLLLPGGRSILADDRSNGYSDGQAMRDLAVENGVPRELVPDIPESTDTLTNVLTCLPYIDSSAPVVSMAQKDHAPRSLWCMNLALSNKSVMNFEADGYVKHGAVIQEQALLMIYRAAFLGIRPGDIESISEKNNQLQNFVANRKYPIMRLLSNKGHYL